MGRGAIIHQGGNGGYQAINLAYLWGAKAIVLLGMDCGVNAKGEVHWHGRHGAGLSNPDNNTFAAWRAKFHTLADDLRAEGVPIYNCSRETTLDCFPRHSLEEVAQLTHHA